MEHSKDCMCHLCLPGDEVPPPDQCRGLAPNPTPAGDKEKPTPNPSQDFGVSAQSNEGNKSEVRSPIQSGTKSEIAGERDYKNESQQNLIKIVEYLARDVFKPVTTQEIMEALALTKSKAHWTLHNLKIGGWAEQVSSGWRLSPDLVKIADAVRATLKEVMHRYL